MAGMNYLRGEPLGADQILSLVFLLHLLNKHIQYETNRENGAVFITRITQLQNVVILPNSLFPVTLL
jgi:hypothetical protein